MATGLAGLLASSAWREVGGRTGFAGGDGVRGADTGGGGSSMLAVAVAVGSDGTMTAGGLRSASRGAGSHASVRRDLVPVRRRGVLSDTGCLQPPLPPASCSEACTVQWDESLQGWVGYHVSVPCSPVQWIGRR